MFKTKTQEHAQCPHCVLALIPSNPQTYPPFGHCPNCESSFALCSEEELVQAMSRDAEELR